MIDRNHPEVALTDQAEILSLSRSSLYYQPVGATPEEVAAKHRIDEIYTKYPFCGSRRMTLELRKEMIINRKTVQRYMRKMGIAAGDSPAPLQSWLEVRRSGMPTWQKPYNTGRGD